MANKKITAVGFDLYGVIVTDNPYGDRRILNLITHLRKQGIVVGLLSNVDANNEFLSKYHGIFSSFDRVLLSSNIGVAKPHPQAYYRLIAQLGSDPQETLFIDDTISNVEGANDAGLTGILYEDYQKLLQDLEKCGLSVEDNALNQA